MFEAEKLNTNLKNTELVKHCASDLKNKNAWLEFCIRYEQHIYNQVVKECKNLKLNKTCFQFEETIKDLVQDVYLRLIENDCKALKTFRGESENSIYSYLSIISKNVVKNYIIKMQAQKRPQIEKSLDECNVLTGENGTIYYIDNNRSTMVFDTEQEFRFKILKEEIKYHLAKILTGKKKKRNQLIYQLHLYSGFSPKEIALFFDFGISSKHISNIISYSRKKLIKTLSPAKQHENITC